MAREAKAGRPEDLLALGDHLLRDARRQLHTGAGLLLLRCRGLRSGGRRLFLLLCILGLARHGGQAREGQHRKRRDPGGPAHGRPPGIENVRDGPLRPVHRDSHANQSAPAIGAGRR